MKMNHKYIQLSQLSQLSHLRQGNRFFNAVNIFKPPSNFCFLSELILAGASKFPWFSLGKVTLSFPNKDKRDVQVLQLEYLDSRLINSEQI